MIIPTKHICGLHFGYININGIEILVKDGPLESLQVGLLPTCESCLEKVKWPRDLLPENGARANECLELIHTSVCGALNIQAKGGYEYFVIFTNNCSKFVSIYLMRHKSEIYKKFKEFQTETEK